MAGRCKPPRFGTAPDERSKIGGKVLNPAVNRELFGTIAFAAFAAAILAEPALARDKPKPRLAIDPVTARTLLAPVEDARVPGIGYRLDPGLGPASGPRVRLSLEVGESTVFAITGRLTRQPGPPGPLDSGHAKALGLKRTDSGKVYGMGVSRTVNGVDLSATYQYSKLRDEQASDSEARIDGPGRSHSLRATARIRFRP